MRLITWNCRHTFTKDKIEVIHQFQPDVLIIQECIQGNLEECKKIWNNYDWYGDHLEYEKYKNGDLGIGIFSSKYEIERSVLHNRDIRYVVPYNIKNENIRFNLFSAWTKTDGVKNPYIGQINEALEYKAYEDLLKRTIFIGDFNANMIWDIKENVKDFSKALTKFAALHMKSAYHTYTNEEFGQENQSTSYQPKGKFHIDYCFVPEEVVVEKVEIKSFDNDRLSDHLPLIIDIKF